MKTSALPSLSGLSPAEALRVEQLCTDYETAWKDVPNRPRPRVEDFLKDCAGPPGVVLLCELLRLELDYCRRHGDQPQQAEYLARFPGHETFVCGVFAAVGLGEDPADAQTLVTLPASPSGAAGGTVTAEVPGYEILGLLGQGGMGAVFKARQLSANRLVALKVIRADRLCLLESEDEQRQWLARFHWEAEAVANLDHAHIVPLYEVGEHNGQPYFSMKFVEGSNLAAEAGRFGQDPRAAADVLAKVARAVHHAHQRQILHRDLKPHNILIDSQGQPHVTDFGLARRIKAAPTQGSISGGLLGTPAYMAPEQVRADSGLTTAVDVYGLGAVLYHLLTGSAPQESDSIYQTLISVLEREPHSPRARNPRVDRDLETICLKCLSKDPAQRYGSAEALAEELDRWLRGEPIQARRAGPVERLRKWVRRNPWLAAASTCALLALLAAVGFAFYGYQQHKLVQDLQLQQAIDDAIATALGGNLELSEKAIRKAELRKASTGQVRLLRALVSFQRSDVKPAIAELEQAARLMPESAAVHALLAIFYFRAGQWAKHDEQMKELAGKELVAPEDFLFKGYQQSLLDPDLGLQTLDQAMEQYQALGQHSAVAHAMRAEARARYALDRQDQAMAEEARQDARIARGLLPGNPFVLSASVQAHLAAAILFQESGQRGEREAAWKEMAPDVKRLQHFADFPWVGAHLAQYFEQIGRTNAASEALRQAATGFKNNPAVFDYAADLYRHGKIKKALQVLSQRRDKDDDSEGDRLQACLLAESQGREAALKAIVQWQTDYPDPGNIGDAMIVWLLLGRKADAQEVAGRMDLPDQSTSAQRQEYQKRYKEYASGNSATSIKDLLRAADPLRSCRCSAHFLIGMTYLADGDRNRAKHHLGEAVKTHDYFNNDYTLSRVFLARLNDRAWPPWLRRKTPEVESDGNDPGM